VIRQLSGGDREWGNQGPLPSRTFAYCGFPAARSKMDKGCTCSGFTCRFTRKRFSSEIQSVSAAFLSRAFFCQESDSARFLFWKKLSAGQGFLAFLGRSGRPDGPLRRFIRALPTTTFLSVPANITFVKESASWALT